VRVEAQLAAMRPAVAGACAALGVQVETPLEELTQARLRTSEGDRPRAGGAVSPVDLARLNEIRARHLDWTRETGYLGFFAENPGIRYMYERRLEVQMDLLAAMPREALLEVGCGAGVLALLAADLFSRVIATDISPTAVAFARRLAAELGVSNVHFVVADAERLPFRDACFPAVAIGEVIAHVASPARTAGELARVTVAGGSLLLSTPCGFSPTRTAVWLAARLGFGPGALGDRYFDQRAAEAAREAGEPLRPEAFVRLKRHFRFREVAALAAAAGFRLRRRRGATLDLPPPVLVYRHLRGWMIGVVRALEAILNRTGLFARLFAVSSVFLFEREDAGHAAAADAAERAA
jgi:SAM-dependent methyltransferase